MKILKAGKLKDKRKIAQGKCAACDTTFEFEKSDVQKDSPDKGMYVECPLPECGHHIHISEDTYSKL